jgi:hypothetical protein
VLVASDYNNPLLTRQLIFFADPVENFLDQDSDGRKTWRVLSHLADERVRALVAATHQVRKKFDEPNDNN